MYERGLYGPTRECVSDDCSGCAKCAGVEQLVRYIREGNMHAALELALRVEHLMGDGSIIPGTAGGFVRGRLQPVPAVAMDALEAAVEMKRGRR